MRRRTRHVQVNHPLRLRLMVRLARHHRIRRLRHRRRLLLHRMHGDGPEAELTRRAKKLAARGELELVVADGVHGVKGLDF